MVFVIDSRKQYIVSGQVMVILNEINHLLNDRYIDNKFLDEDKLYFYLGVLFDLTFRNRIDNISQLPDGQKFKIG